MRRPLTILRSLLAKVKEQLGSWSRRIRWERPRRVSADLRIIQAFDAARLLRADSPPGWIVDFLGIRTRWSFIEEMGTHTREQVCEMWQQLPDPNTIDLEYWEWVDLLEAVRSARERFVFVELGAGYGRWAVRAARLLQQVNPLPCTLVAVEAEPTHFEWMREHFRDNGLNPDEHVLVCAPVAASEGPVNFLVGGAGSCYGQEIVADPETRYGELRAQQMEAVPLVGLLESFSKVDLIDLDVQGAEYDVLAAAIERLDQRVKRVQIGTHGTQVELQLRKLFREHGWQLTDDVPRGARLRLSPSGRVITADDGVQSWLNPRLGN